MPTKNTITILIIDDDRSILEAISLMLETEGYAVKSDTGEKALEMIINEHPDLILLDVLLGGRDGKELARQINLNPEIQSIPIILFSASASMNQRIAQEAGAREFLPKPFDMEDLLSMVARLTA